VEIGSGIRDRLVARTLDAAPAGALIVVSDDTVCNLWAEEAFEWLNEQGRKVVAVRLPTGEGHKDLRTVERVWDAALDAGVDRQGLILAIGGGVVGDTAGFAASTLLRGVHFAQLPSTLLAMLDSSVGGKTGINRTHGKNLVGSFHQPRFVLCDLDLLSTLPEPERRSGLGEAVKSAWFAGDGALRHLEVNAAALLAGDASATASVVRMGVQTKASFVVRDEHDMEKRRLLNLGHTIGHGIEAASGFTLRHGFAVALGLIAAFRIARRLGACHSDELERMTSLLRRLELPIALDHYLSSQVMSFVALDKKREGETLQFVVPTKPGEAYLHSLTIAQLAALVRP
jgi:3-dehydroquinate synthase